MEFIFREEHIKLWYTGRQSRELIMEAEKLEFPLAIRQIVIHCGTNNIEENTPNDNTNGPLFLLYCTVNLFSVGKKNSNNT